MKLLLLAAVVVCYVAYAEAGCPSASSCFTCKGTKTRDDCMAKGDYKSCKMKNAKCQVMTHYDDKGNMDLYESECKTAEACRSRHTGPPPGKCTYDSGINAPLGKRASLISKRAAPALVSASCRTCDDAVCDGTCHCKGDPHCKTLDGKKIKAIKTECAVIMLRDGCTGGEIKNSPTFEVIADIDKQEGTKKYFVRKVKVDTGASGIDLDQRKDKVKINDKETSIGVGETLNVDGHEIYRSGDVVEVKLDNGVIIRWDFINKVETVVPDSHRTHTCGVCGNFNGIPEDDMLFGEPLSHATCPSTSRKMNALGVTGGEGADESLPGHDEAYAASWISEVPVGDSACYAECHAQ